MASRRRRVALSQRDREILELLARRRAETLDYLHETYFPDGARKTALNRLRQLELAGFVQRESVSLAPLTDGRLENVYTLGPRGKTALELRSLLSDEFEGRRFSPTLRATSMPHQIATSRVADWLGATLRPEHLLPSPSGRGGFRHRPDGVYEAAEADAHGRNLVFLEVDLGHYSRERVLGKVKAFLDNPDARSIVLVTRMRERARRLGDWVRDAYGDDVMRRVQPLTFEQVKAGGVLRRGTEPLPPERAEGRAA